MSESCGSCVILLRDILPPYDEEGANLQRQDRQLDCCGRVICGNCIRNNQRFATYCPFCQISSGPSCLPQGLRDPPSYSPPSSSSFRPNQRPTSDTHDLPAYSPLDAAPSLNVKPPAEDVLHFLDHDIDSLTSLALRYNVPISALRRANNITSDHLLLARPTIIIPKEFYKGGVSLSPRPIEGEEERTRKATVRRWMVACKVSEYDIALSYLKLADYDLDVAILEFKEDERWEKEHPRKGRTEARGGVGVKYNLGRKRFTGQR